MIDSTQKLFLTILSSAYFFFLEVTSLGRTSEVFPCIITSQKQSPDGQFAYQACAPLHEAIFRGLKLMWEAANHDNILAFGTLMIACFTLTLWWSTTKLWKASERHSERELRAYLVIKGKDFREQSPEHEKFVHHLEIRNTGKTPAHRVSVESVTCVLDYPLPKDFDFPITASGTNPSVMTLGTGEPAGHESFADEPLSAEELLRIKSEGSGRRLYTYGTITYTDVFERDRYTNFCHYYLWRTERKEDGRHNIVISAHPSEQHNDAS